MGGFLGGKERPIHPNQLQRICIVKGEKSVAGLTEEGKRKRSCRRGEEDIRGGRGRELLPLQFNLILRVEDCPGSHEELTCKGERGGGSEVFRRAELRGGERNRHLTTTTKKVLRERRGKGRKFGRKKGKMGKKRKEEGSSKKRLERREKGLLPRIPRSQISETVEPATEKKNQRGGAKRFP